MQPNQITAYDRILDRLRQDNKQIRQDRLNHVMAQCPAHDDHTPSLSITQIEGGLLVYCFAHCTNQDIAAALGWSLGELLHDDRIGASYLYADGRQVRRTYDTNGKKRFYQSGQINGAPTILYRLDKIEEARAKSEPVMLVGSEKDVHAIESLGAYATCAPMGEGNWHKVDPTPLYGLEVIAIAHDDQAGEKWAGSVRATLDGKAALNFAKAKVGNDATDHIAAGYTLAEIIPWYPPEPGSVSEEPKRRIRLTPLSTIKPRPVRWGWADRIPVGELTLTPGRGGLGKSTFPRLGHRPPHPWHPARCPLRHTEAVHSRCL